MSSAEATAPNVQQHAGYVEPSEAFVNAHSGKATETSPNTGTLGTAEEKVGKDEVKVTASPITQAVLGYKAPGLVNQFRFKKHFFWLGDEPVPAKDLSQYLRGEKPEVGNPVAAWSSQTGKGLMYFAKGEDTKKFPIGVLNLADASEVAKEGNEDFSFKIGKQKHTFQAKDKDERNGFVVALEKDVKHAAESKDSMQKSDGYKESLKQLEKPGGIAAGGAAAGATAATGAGAATAAAAASSDKKDADKKDADKKDKVESENERQKSSTSDEGKTKAKSRSQSRNKRSSIFGMFGKKDDGESKDARKEEKADEKEAKKEEKKEEKAAEKEAKSEDKAQMEEAKKEQKEEKKEERAEKKDHKHEGEAVGGAAAGTAAVGGAAAVAANDDKKDGKKEEEKKAESPKNTTERSKSNKRRSIFGGIFEKAKSPSAEKKESDAMSPAGATKKETSSDEPSMVPGPDGNVMKPNSAAEAKAVSSVFKDDPTEPSDHKVDESTTAATGAAGTTGANKTATTTSATGEPANDRRRSFFGSMKKDRKTEDSDVSGGESPKQKQSAPSKFGEIFRRNSKAAKGSDKRDEKKSANTPATVQEAGEGTEATKSEGVTGVDGAADDETEAENEAKKDRESKANGAAIGDVVPEAVTVGQAQSTSGTSPAQVSTAA